MRTSFGKWVPVMLLSALSVGAAWSQADPAAPPRTTQDAADRVRTKVVILKVARDNRVSSATGFLVRPGLVLTAAHAVRTPGRITVWVNGVKYAGRLLDLHRDHDLAALSLTAPELQLKPVELLAATEALEKNEPLIVLAGPSQGANVNGDPVNRVIIPARFRNRVRLRMPSGTLGPMLEMDGSVEKGDSGSPVIRVKDARVVGVLSSRELPDEAGVSRVCYAVPVEAIQTWLDGLKQPVNEDEDFYLKRAAGK
jgi:S1-C subfamily serine protease